MILILIPAVWLALVAFFVLLCRSAGRADALLSATMADSDRREPRRGALVLFEQPRTHVRHDQRLRRSDARGRGVRGRGGRCVAGS
jgi:hypothetical protein